MPEFLVADIMLFAWPVIALVLFARLGRERGLIWSVAVGYLFLPEARVHELPGLPDYDKLLAIAVGALLGIAVFRDRASWSAASAASVARDKGLQLQVVWAEALGRDVGEVPRDKGFQDLGASIRETSRVTRLMKRYGYGNIAISGLQQGDTINDLSRHTPTDGLVGARSKTILVVTLVLLAVLALGSFMTMLDNRAPLVNADRVRSGLGFRDVITMISEVFIAAVPLLLAMQYLRTPRHFREVLVALAVLGFVYSLFVLAEARLSPQMNNWVYGYFQHDWRQHLRGGDFRPIVFLRHGLWVGFFILTALMCAFALYRSEEGPKKALWLAIGLWLLAVLLISKNMGATMLALMFIPVLLFMPRTIQTKIVLVVTIIFLAYPTVRQNNLLPIEGFLNFVGSISEARRQSLEFRLTHETYMIDRAMEKPLFGWGGWGRWRVIDEKGRDVTVSDGIWIIKLGERGWVGYICFFGLLTLPLIMLSFQARQREAGPEIMALGLIMAANLIYMVPNSTLSPLGWLITGTVAAFIRWDMLQVNADEEEGEVEDRSPYTRFPRSHQRPAIGARTGPHGARPV